MTHASLFSGIGGFDLAAEWMGWQNLFHCEIDEFCQTVLKYYWPDAKTYKDIRNTDFTIWRGRIDVLSGGFPCQPFSVAGKRRGSEDDRHLWPEMLRAIREIAPRYVVGENVSGLLTWDNGVVFESVCADLEDEGYEVQPYRIPACAKDAPHRRDRWWFVGNDNNMRNATECEFQERKNAITFRCLSHATHYDHKRELQQKGTEQNERRRISHGIENAADTCNTRLQRNEQRRTPEQRPGPPRPIAERFENESWLEAATRLCSMDDGFPGRLDAKALYSYSKSNEPTKRPGYTYGKWRRESLKAYGNAIVPQVTYEIFKGIEKYDNLLD